MSKFTEYLEQIQNSKDWKQQIKDIIDPLLLKFEDTNEEHDSEIKNIDNKRIEISYEYGNGESFENTYINIPFKLIEKNIKTPINGEVEIEIDFEDADGNDQTYDLLIPIKKAEEIIKIWRDSI